ncbi:tripartite tricarboxylate transporter TctB family protein [Bosea caraganae]|uniref:tripartite tricarboxylate transporter TctB family protein n=1 Tax=Bosea caraganae TaxID=2763117 RepID=UPI0015F04353|nr:tripartite tricarboxylate transporter TctB family protein [Bosea caraganae]
MSFLLLALVYGWIAYRDLPFGVMLNMGPGYFPLVLCTILAGIGALLTIRALLAGLRTGLPGRFAWRPVVAICLAVILFGTFLRELGLFASVFCTVLICSLASARMNWLQAGLAALMLAVICTGVFAYGVRLPLPVVGTWFTGLATWTF